MQSFHGKKLWLAPQYEQTLANIPHIADYVDMIILKKNEAKIINIPTSSQLCFFSCTGNFYLCAIGTAQIPDKDDILNGTGSELNPDRRNITNLTRFSVISDAKCILTISYYSNCLNQNR